MPASNPDHAARLGIALQCQAAVLSRPLLGEAATTLATELANALALEFVSVALLDDGRTVVVGMSHGDGAIVRTAPVGLIDAINEAIDQASIVQAADDSGDALQVRRAHQAYASAHGVHMCSVPFERDGRVIGAISICAAVETPLVAQDIALIQQIGTMAAPVLARLREDGAPIHKRLMRALRGTRRTSPAQRRGALAASLVLLAALFIPMPNSVHADARVEGAVQRVIVAPTDGYIRKAFARAGDEVREGQVLVELVDRDLRIERRKLASEVAQHQNAFASALTLADRGQMVIHRARLEEARARIELVDHQLERGLIRAPMGSVVLTGQLDQAEGAPVERGEVLMTLAPKDRYRLIVEVDERDARLLSLAGEGKVALSALPYDPIEFSITRIMPVAEQRDGRHYVAVEGELRHPPGAVAPGMRGIARIGLEPSPLLAQWTRRLRQWLGLKLWSWWGA